MIALQCERLENESQLQYIKRLTENRKLYDLDYVEWSNLVTGGYTCSSDNARKAYYVVSAMLNNMDNSTFEDLRTQQMETVLAEFNFEIEAKKAELYREKVKLQDVQREMRNRYRWEARWEELRDEIVRVIEAQDNIHIPLHEPTNRPRVESSVLLSDWHLGLGINTPHNKFDEEEAKKRVTKLANSVIAQAKRNDVTVLHVDMLGDILSGIIHTTTRIYQTMNIVQQIGFASELLSQFINTVKPHFEEVHLHSVAGNHDRITANYKEHLEEENFMKLIDLYVENKTGISIEYSNVDDEIQVYTLYNGKLTVAMQHGHNCKKTASGVKDVANYLDMHIDFLHMGHFHNFECMYGVIINGCLCGSDTFANKHRFNDEACQVYVIYYEDGSRVIYDIKLGDC